MPPIPNIPLQYYNFTKKLNSFFVFYYIFLLQKRCIPTIEYIFSTLILQFKLYDDNHFEAYALEFNGVPQSKFMKNTLIDEVMEDARYIYDY